MAEVTDCARPLDAGHLLRADREGLVLRRERRGRKLRMLRRYLR